MKKTEAIKSAKKAFPEMHPTEASGFTLTEDGTAVLISGYQEPVVVVLHHEDDLARLITLCQLALDNIKKQR
jgi:hypothetical protein